MPSRSLRLILPLFAVLATACGSDGGLAPGSPTDGFVLTRLEVTPDSTALVQGYAYLLKVEARDQFGMKMVEDVGTTWADKVTYVSSAPSIAEVSGDGVVTAVAPGVATITASLTYAGGTAAGSVITTVDRPTATSVTLTALQFPWWSSYEVSLKAPATVTWVVPDSLQAETGTVWLNFGASNAEKLEFINGVAARTFSTPGAYYFVSEGAVMWDQVGGVVRVY
jgi:hypothetical protein